MIRSVEFDLETKSEANMRFASKAGMFAKSERVKKQRAAVTAVLASSFGALVPPAHVQNGVTMIANKVDVRLVRISPGTLDDDNLRGALKAVRDAVARWIGIDDRDPFVSWSYAQEQGAQRVYRVRLVITDRCPGADRIVVLAETASEGRAAASRVKREVKAAGTRHGVSVYRPEAGARAASSAARSKAEGAFAKLTGKPTALDLRDAAERVLAPATASGARSRGVPPTGQHGAGLDGAPKHVPHRDPGEERPARDLAACTTCGVAVGLPCITVIPGVTPGAPCLRLLYGVHIARAIAAGLHVPEDDRAHLRPARAPTNGQRRIVPPAQALLPLPAAYIRLPWESRPCGECKGEGSCFTVGGVLTGLVHPTCCAACHGGKVHRPTRRDPRHDGEHAPPTVRYTVPAEHRARFGDAVTLTRRRTTLAKIGDVWLYE